MLIVDSIHQPTTRSTAQALGAALQSTLPEEMDVAAAYITGSGLLDLLRVIEESLGAGHPAMRQRWLTSFDYCRTEPIALEKMMSIPNAEVRIYDAEFCLSRSCTPRVPFHPKIFLFRSQQYDRVLAGSGNISRSGLARGFEAGLSVGIDRHAVDVEPSATQSINACRDWFEVAWAEASPLTTQLLSRYTDVFQSVENLNYPSHTEDDVASDHSTVGSLKAIDLQKLRVCRNFWIEAGNITKNRGPGLPGNQLMMKRLSRVFFGFAPHSVAENSPIGTVEIFYAENDAEPFSLTYSDNKMDKLILPIPDHGGPVAYDNENLLFRKVSPGKFELLIGSQNDKKDWMKKSGKIGASFAMKSGRKWGVF